MASERSLPATEDSKPRLDASKRRPRGRRRSEAARARWKLPIADQDDDRKRPIKSPMLPKSKFSALLALLVIIHNCHRSCSSPAAPRIERHPEVYPSVSLAKFGLVRGLRFDWRWPAGGGSGEPLGNQSSGGGSPPHQQHRGHSVGAFLGLAYAAPPRGLLRFMPPGAPRPTPLKSIDGGGSGNSDSIECLAPDERHGASRSGRAPGGGTPTRPQLHFGPECVRLADWLAADTRANTKANTKANTPEDAAERRRRLERRRTQSEDCLNLNVFVPLEPHDDDDDDDSDKNRDGHSQSGGAGAERTNEPADVRDDRNERRATGHNGGTDSIRRLQEDMARGRQRSDVCRLQPLWSSQPRDNASHLQPPSGIRNQLPVIVLVHSAAGLDDKEDEEDEDDDDGDAGAHANRRADATERNVPNGSEIHDNAPDNWRARPRSKANSLVHLELARRTKSIVITFNYRIGLLGYLPYVDSDDQRHRSAQTVRSNHALWDQIGLLHWVRHNVAQFGGEPANVSLMSADSEAVQMVQLLALSPMAKGLFKRLILVHEEPAETDPNAYFERLLWMAQRARPLQRKLITELGLLLERQHDTNGTAANSTNRSHLDELHQVQANFEIDRRVLETLKTGSLERLAELELGVSKINVAAQFATTIRLADVIGSPNLDDKLLFPHFSLLIKANDSIDSASGPHPGRDGFWSWLAGGLDEQKLGQRDQLDSAPFENFQLEAEYCGYMRHLYKRMLDPDCQSDTPRQNRLLANELKRIDPLRLIPRVSDQQLAMIMSTSRGQSATHQVDSNRLIDTQSSSSTNSDKRHPTGKQFVKWRRRNRTANAIEFYHLRHAHLLQHLLVRQKGDEFHLNSGDHLVEESNQISSSAPKLGAGDGDEEEAEEELDEWLVTRLQRQQQQRSIMLAQHQHSSQEPAPGYLPLRAKRHATRGQGGDSLGQAGALAQQLVELLSGFDLLILFRAGPLVNASDNLATSSPSLPGYISMSQGKSLSKPMASYLQMADLHYIASLRSSPDNLNRLCEFSATNFLRRSEPQMANSFVLVEPGGQQTLLQLYSDETSFMCDSKQRGRQTALDLIGQFARLGSFEAGGTNPSQRFDTLERHLCWSVGVEASERTLVGEVISAQMNLAAYLKRVLNGSTKSSNAQEAEHLLLEHPSLAPLDLVNCLLELDSISTRDRVSRRPPSDNSSRLTQDCLLNATNRLRLQLRADAAEELEPLIRQYFVIAEQQRQRQQTAASRNSEQMPRDAASEPPSPLGDRRASTMTTRTLVNQSEGPYLDQLASVSLSAMPGRSQQLERELTNLVGGNQQFDVSSNSSTAAMHSGGIRGYFAKTYKDAVGQALGIVIGTGSLIILLNLLIVLVIAWRSRRNLSRPEGQNGHNTRQAVQDCSNTAVNVAVPYNFGLDQSHLIGESLSNSLDCQQQALIDSVLELNQSLSNHQQQQQQQQQQMNGCDFQTQLSNSTPLNVDPSHQLHMSRAQTCSSISSNSQRAATAQNSKSIKFDLSGSEGRALNRKATTNGHCQRGIMKQPVMTSDEEEHIQQQQRGNQQETAMRTMMVEGLCDTHYHKYRANGHSKPDACARELAISPVSLDVLDLIPLENLTSGYDGHELALVSNSSDDYQQMVVGCNFGTTSGSNSMQTTVKCPHHEVTDQMQWQQNQSQLRGGSLTSPYGSQSTHSTTSASNANGHGSNSFGVNKMSLHVPDLSPKRAPLAGQHSFCPAPAKLSMNSPPSSATISGAHTPNSMGNQQLYYTLHGPVAIGENISSLGACQANRGQLSQVMVYKADSLTRGTGNQASGNATIDPSSYGRLIMLPAEICNDKKINNDSL